MIKNLLLTGRPGIGKTTVIKKILSLLPFSAGGFFTGEIREGGERKGFKITTLDGKEGVLAHVNIKSPYRVSRYGVDIKALESIAVPAIYEEIDKKNLIVIDEIGKMEMFSGKFRKAVLEALDSKKVVLATITGKPHPFADKIKQREDVVLIRLTLDNRDRAPQKIAGQISAILK